MVSVTLSTEAFERLNQACVSSGVSRSRYVEDLIMAPGAIVDPTRERLKEIDKVLKKRLLEA